MKKVLHYALCMLVGGNLAAVHPDPTRASAFQANSQTRDSLVQRPAGGQNVPPREQNAGTNANSQEAAIPLIFPQNLFVEIDDDTSSSDDGFSSSSDVDDNPVVRKRARTNGCFLEYGIGPSAFQPFLFHLAVIADDDEEDDDDKEAEANRANIKANVRPTVRPPMQGQVNSFSPNGKRIKMSPEAANNNDEDELSDMFNRLDVQDEPQPDSPTMRKVIRSLSSVYPIYHTLFRSGGGFNATPEMVEIIYNFIESVANLSSDEINRRLVPALQEPSFLAVPSYQILVELVDAIRNFKGPGNVEIANWALYGKIAKVLNSVIKEDAIRRIFRSDMFVVDRAGIYEINNHEGLINRVQFINELLKTRLVSSLALDVPSINTDLFFRGLELNDELSSIGLSGDPEHPFNITAEVSRCLSKAGVLCDLTISYANLTDAQAFFSCTRNVSFLLRCWDVSFAPYSPKSYKGFRQSGIVGLEYHLDRGRDVTEVMRWISSLPEHLKFLYMDLREAKKTNIVSICREVLRVCPEIEELELLGEDENEWNAGDVSVIKPYVSKHCFLRELRFDNLSIAVEQRCKEAEAEAAEEEEDIEL